MGISSTAEAVSKEESKEPTPTPMNLDEPQNQNEQPNPQEKEDNRTDVEQGEASAAAKTLQELSDTKEDSVHDSTQHGEPSFNQGEQTTPKTNTFNPPLTLPL